MTLFAGFRCADQRNANEHIFVICADSQETIEEPDGSSYRVSLQKIEPKTCGNFDLAIGGSSANGELLDACVYHIQESVSGFSKKTIPDLKEFISDQLLHFGKNDAKLYSPKERTVSLLIMARAHHGPFVELWQNKAAKLLPIKRRILIGWREYLYQHALERLYPENGPLLPPQQAVLLGLDLLKLAEDTCNYVKAPITVIVGHRGTIRQLSADKVRKSKERIEIFRSQVDRILLSLSDHTIHRRQYEAQLEEFKKTALQLRDEYVQDAAPKTMEELMVMDDPIPNLPSGSIISLMASGPLILSEDVKKQEEWAKKIEVSKILSGEGPVLLTVHCKCGHDFEVEIPTWNHLITGPKFNCKCGEENAASGMNVNDARLKINPVAAHVIVDKND